MERGKFQGRIGRLCEFAVYEDNGATVLYRDRETEPCFTGGYDAAERFAGVTGYRSTGRGPMALYADNGKPGWTS